MDQMGLSVISGSECIFEINFLLPGVYTKHIRMSSEALLETQTICNNFTCVSFPITNHNAWNNRTDEKTKSRKQI